jgi:hypothetical protein
VGVLISPIIKLMDLIYTTKKILNQWRVAKTTPVYKNKVGTKTLRIINPAPISVAHQKS